ncbi:uncharacterized protein LOC119345270 [Triticum dicoccoides]|uniref:uncharacterized protein LOC119345270 n=1 Tax=Triticum dicoccoides TaxID=85692 RepID=UPI00188FD388|nr:uncharacterized protein LOC119345270 [Triticum dicoccoides]
MVQSVEYDHTASIECLRDPMKPLYKGGIIQNSEFNNGLMGWSTYRNIKAGVGKSASGNRFAVVQGAISSLFSAAGDAAALQSHSVYQKVQMQGDTHYSLSGMHRSGFPSLLYICPNSLPLSTLSLLSLFGSCNDLLPPSHNIRVFPPFHFYLCSTSAPKYKMFLQFYLN